MLYKKIRTKITELSKKISNSGMNLGTWGNLSARVNTDIIAITPSGIEYDKMLAQDIVIVNTDGIVIEGDKRASIELPLHSEIYRNKTEVNAIIHTHSVFCTAFAISREPIPASCEDMIQVVGGQIDVADYFLPGSKQLAIEVVDKLGNKNAILLANHGLLTVAEDLSEAYKIVQIVEKSAQAIIFANTLGGAVELSSEDINFMRDFYLNKYGQ